MLQSLELRRLNWELQLFLIQERNLPNQESIVNTSPDWGSLRYYQHPKPKPCRSFSGKIQEHKTKLFLVSFQTDEFPRQTVVCVLQYCEVSSPGAFVHCEEVVKVRKEVEVPLLLIHCIWSGIEWISEGSENEVLKQSFGWKVLEHVSSWGTAWLSCSTTSSWNSCPWPRARGTKIPRNTKNCFWLSAKWNPGFNEYPNWALIFCFKQVSLSSSVSFFPFNSSISSHFHQHFFYSSLYNLFHLFISPIGLWVDN